VLTDDDDGTRAIRLTVAIFLLGVFIVFWLLLPPLSRIRSIDS